MIFEVSKNLMTVYVFCKLSGRASKLAESTLTFLVDFIVKIFFLISIDYTWS